MPTYDYVCKDCQHAFEHWQTMTSNVLRTCPKCKKRKLRRLIGSGAGVIFKGSGFYETDYKRKKRGGTKSSESDDSSSSSSSSGDDKPAAKKKDDANASGKSGEKRSDKSGSGNGASDNKSNKSNKSNQSSKGPKKKGD